MKSGLAATIVTATTFFTLLTSTAPATATATCRITQLGAHAPATAIPSINISNDIACNRFPPAGLPVEFGTARSCSPSPLLTGWEPLPWPKFDPLRRIILVSQSMGAGYGLHAIDESGAIAPFNPPGLPPFDHRGIAPVGDGRIYFIASVGPLSSIDINDSPHAVLDWNGVPYINQDPVTDFVYDRFSQSLILLSSTSGTGGPCTTPNHSNAVVSKLALNSAGDRLLGPPVRYVFCSTGNTSVPRITRHPDGRLLFHVSNSASSVGAQVVSLDTTTMTVSPFCTVAPAPGSAFLDTPECAYSTELGGILAVIQIPCFFCPTNYSLRLFPQGYVGAGIPLCSWSGEYRHRFVEFLR